MYFMVGIFGKEEFWLIQVLVWVKGVYFYLPHWFSWLTTTGKVTFVVFYITRGMFGIAHVSENYMVHDVWQASKSLTTKGSIKRE